ncbi:hypothetical protein BDW67DRAFT_150877 [Aspergillus spinulosporus]
MDHGPLWTRLESHSIWLPEDCKGSGVISLSRVGTWTVGLLRRAPPKTVTVDSDPARAQTRPGDRQLGNSESCRESRRDSGSSCPANEPMEYSLLLATAVSPTVQGKIPDRVGGSGGCSVGIRSCRYSHLNVSGVWTDAVRLWNIVRKAHSDRLFASPRRLTAPTKRPNAQNLHSVCKNRIA